MHLIAHRRPRRWLGAALLAAALLLLIAGQTLLKDRLDSVGFLVYWLACFVFTLGAIVIAFLDARAVARRNLEEQRSLFENTLRKIAADADTKTRSQQRDPKPTRGKPSSRNGS